MDLGDIILILLFIYLMVIAVVAGVFRGLGFSFLQALTLSFIFVTFGIWNPVGWMLLLAFGFIQYKRNVHALQARTPLGLESSTVQDQIMLTQGKL